MKKIVKYFSLVVLTTFIFVLTGCGLFGPSLPKPVGKKVQMTVTQLENRIDKLSFNEIDEGYVSVDADMKTSYEYEGDTYYEESKQSMTVNLVNGDKWLDIKSKYKENAGQLESTIKGFESSKNVYFDLKSKNNGLFDEDDDNDIEFFDGKYRMDNDGYYSSLNYLVSSLGGMVESHTSIAYSFEAFAYTQLVKYDFKGLTLYESPTHFSVKLSFNKKDIDSEREEVADILKDIVGFYSDDDLIIEKLKYETVFVFERNKLVAAGLKMDFKAYEDGDLYEAKGFYVVKYDAKQPKPFKYTDYRKIDDLSDIMRNS